MGQLRSGILALQKTCLDMEPAIGELEGQLEDYSSRIFDAGKRIEEGLNTLVMYLIEKLKKAGKTLETEGAKPLKGEMDSNVATFGKGIVQAKADVKAVIAKLAAAQKASAAKLQASISDSTATMTKLKGIAAKKKAKWLKSAKYKAKIGGYLGALDAIDGILKKQAEAINAVAAVDQNDAWVERCYKFNQDMTLKDVKGLMSAGLQTNLKDFYATKETVGNRGSSLGRSSSRWAGSLR